MVILMEVTVGANVKKHTTLLFPYQTHIRLRTQEMTVSLLNRSNNLVMRDSTSPISMLSLLNPKATQVSMTDSSFTP